MSKSSARRFGALIDPDRIYVIEYVRQAGGVEITHHMSVARSMPSVEEASDALVELIRPAAGRGDAQVAAAIRGFGVSYQLLTLPPAGADVLAPIIDREMRRMFPDIEDPLVGFALGGNIDRRTGRAAPAAAKKGLPERRSGASTGEILPLEILAASAPRHVVNTVAATLERAGIRLEHLTVVPQAMARLYREVNGSPQPAALAIMLQGSPVIGVFQGGDVRFISEPPTSDEGLSSVDVQTVIDQVGRARMYLRQQFRGADIEKIFVSADPADQAHVDAVLNAALNVEVVPLAPAMGPPAAIAALGSVLNAESGAEMVLYPSSKDLQRAAEQDRVRTWTLAAAAVCFLAILLAVFTTVSAATATGDLRAERAAADAQMAKIAPAMNVIEERRANMDRANAMRAHFTGRQQLARLINGIRLAQPPNVGLGAATLSRTTGGWRVEITGTAVGASGADVLEGVAEFSRELPARIPLQSFNLDSFEYAGEPGDMSGNFKISFTAIGTP
ncbi:MAG: hypothetical protein ACR2L6_11335 [Gemmatimonadaceae bacterium]